MRFKRILMSSSHCGSSSANRPFRQRNVDPIVSPTNASTVFEGIRYFYFIISPCIISSQGQKSKTNFINFSYKRGTHPSVHICEAILRPFARLRGRHRFTKRSRGDTDWKLTAGNFCQPRRKRWLPTKNYSYT